ncbi:HD-GYP domain-containing protein [Paenisporosarcina antarctica]|uniref:HD-GYP domain-containing protein n=1 Tax=Paenisporosarcina antarctica TaxID=417367 RepID=A0A4P6ZZQ0_9BACL|nr:HD-GYP domain-containing protein [Paenisporosarcina antarctica]QBP41823.1 HD-GYP domain-containing protein [Paenisporosarcina antarctica]
MVEFEQQLLDEYFHEHRSKITKTLVKIIAVFLLMSTVWNILFELFDMPYSRANIVILLICLGILLTLFVLTYLVKINSIIQQFLLLIYCACLIICLYFGSGYTESWSFFLIMPLLAGIYGERKLLLYYSVIGGLLLTLLSVQFPISTYVADGIDISNRILMYIILATFSFFLLNTFKIIYKKQVDIVTKSMEKTIEQVVNSFIVSIEAKDLYTFGHSERVSKYAIEVGKNLPQYQDEKELRKLRLSGLLHDIGKINIPETILTKSGKLSAEEFNIIKTHPVVGARMVEKIEGLQELKDGVLYHHERWDGNGYPTKRKGVDIPLCARILAIVDAFDAMTSNRSYRSQISFEEAFKQLLDGKGTQFDPELIEVVATLQLNFKKVYNESNDPIKEFETLTDLM